LGRYQKRGAWEKRSGTSIELLWRYEQIYYDGGDGRVDADMIDDDPPCGLIGVSTKAGNLIGSNREGQVNPVTSRSHLRTCAIPGALH
jgi:hypothetical protein